MVVRSCDSAAPWLLVPVGTLGISSCFVAAGVGHRPQVGRWCGWPLASTMLRPSTSTLSASFGPCGREATLVAAGSCRPTALLPVRASRCSTCPCRWTSAAAAASTKMPIADERRGDGDRGRDPTSTRREDRAACCATGERGRCQLGWATVACHRLLRSAGPPVGAGHSVAEPASSRLAGGRAVRHGGGAGADQRGAQRDVVLGMGVHREWPAERADQQLAHERDARRTADQHDRRQRLSARPPPSAARGASH